MRQKVTEDDFEGFKGLSVSKNDINEGNVYILYLDTGTNFWKVEVEVWFDGASGNGLVEFDNQKGDMILTQKKNYGRTWYLV